MRIGAEGGPYGVASGTYTPSRDAARSGDVNVDGNLFQAGRNDWGTAGMGGNGQFNRLQALDDVADAVGPWRDRLTEDQDLGLRLIGNFLAWAP